VRPPLFSFVVFPLGAFVKLCRSRVTPVIESLSVDVYANAAPHVIRVARAALIRVTLNQVTAAERRSIGPQCRFASRSLIRQCEHLGDRRYRSEYRSGTIQA
jgi:hypothetical protein